MTRRKENARFVVEYTLHKVVFTLDCKDMKEVEHAKIYARSIGAKNIKEFTVEDYYK